MSARLTFQDNDIFDNPTPRVPTVVCLDTSGSMQGAPIEALSRGVAQLYAELHANDLTRFAADVSVVTFGATIQQPVHFGPITPQPNLRLSADGMTPMGAAIGWALDLLEARRRSYRDAGVDYHQPWLVLMSDGAPTDDINPAIQRIHTLVQQRHLSVLSVAVGDQASLPTLALLSPAQPPFRLQGLAFDRFFQWLSASIERVSASIPGEDLPFRFDNVRSWAKL